MEREQVAIRLDELSVRYGQTLALDSFSCELAWSGVTGLVGANGSGKSTLLDVLSGFVRPDGGAVLRNGSATSVPSRRRMSARLHQRTILPSGVLAKDYLEIAAHPMRGQLLFSGLGKTDNVLTGRVVDAFDRIGVNLNTEIDHLSWGQRRFLALVAVTLTNKPLLLLDEPFAGLDPDVAEEAKQLILREANVRAVLIAEHDLDLIEEIADQILVQKVGRLRKVLDAGSMSRRELLGYF